MYIPAISLTRAANVTTHACTKQILAFMCTIYAWLYLKRPGSQLPSIFLPRLFYDNSFFAYTFASAQLLVLTTLNHT